ncbi:hypothetical protein BT96DRAFT_1013770 [Gymnopus androsaceus JB14]|uniref:Uncharacterized protein n=1 Tax=Gymnopus androsaceus JB14 TaxID=1447944 RepID=A0A6A4IFH5_9AGAR|nr:hypothetical protein BT96DRAFT_1013770 [Gymnopus androsaceus JB14]
MLVRSSPVNQPLPPFCIPIPSSLFLSLLSQGRISQVELRSSRFLLIASNDYIFHTSLPTTSPLSSKCLSPISNRLLFLRFAQEQLQRPYASPALNTFIHLHDSPRQSRMLPLHAPHVSVPSSRKFSTSSSATNESRSPSPSLSDASSSSLVNSSVRSLSRSPSESRHAQPFMRLVPSDMHNADAVVLIPPPGPGPRKPLLLVGPALKLVSHPQRHIARGARIYPYRKDSRPSLSRKSSWALTDCSEL